LVSLSRSKNKDIDRKNEQLRKICGSKRRDVTMGWIYEIN
jgi:hypothetical protein